MGLVSVGLFLLFIFAILKKTGQAYSHLKNSQERVFLLAVFWGLLFIGSCDFYLIHTPHGRILFFGFGALLYSIAQVRYNPMQNLKTEQKYV